MGILLNLLRGNGLPPFFVGLARAFAEAVLIAALGAAAVFLVSIDYTVAGISSEITALIIVPGIWQAFRTFEALLDQIDPTKRRAGNVNGTTPNPPLRE